MDKIFLAQTQLLLDILPLVANEKIFALKGGTALNFFIRNLPRLSVDIDLTYCNIEARETTIAKARSSLERIAAKIKTLFNAKVKFNEHGAEITKVYIYANDVNIKIEPNYLVRGTVYPISNMDSCIKIAELFQRQISMQVLSQADLYAGKLCAALDRQHPRDLFDLKLLFDNEGLDELTRRAFVIYLAMHNRPIDELLQPNVKDFNDYFYQEFKGMTLQEVSLFELIETRDKLFEQIKTILTLNEQKFLLSLVRMEPHWELLSLPIDVKLLPGIQWKMLNIARMNPIKRQHYIKNLENIFTRSGIAI